jgi:hypothetical protein
MNNTTDDGAGLAPMDYSIFVETVTHTFCGHIVGSTIRSATEDDIQIAQALHAVGKCTHRVVKDTPGWLYDFRSCFVCGKGLGAI